MFHPKWSDYIPKLFSKIEASFDQKLEMLASNGIIQVMLSMKDKVEITNPPTRM
jgi:hypothetical protein